MTAQQEEDQAVADILAILASVDGLTLGHAFGILKIVDMRLTEQAMNWDGKTVNDRGN